MAPVIMRIWEIRVLIGPFVTHWGCARGYWYRRGTGRENWAIWTSHFSLCTGRFWVWISKLSRIGAGQIRIR
jgi:hypothetical protein